MSKKKSNGTPLTDTGKHRRDAATKNRVNISYLLVIVSMFLIAVSSSVVLEVLRPEKDNSALIIQIFGFLSIATPSVLGFIEARKGTAEAIKSTEKAEESKQAAKETYVLFNGHMTELMKFAKQASFAEGEKKGKKDADARTDQLAEAK